MDNIMSIVVSGSTSGTITLDVPAVAGTNTVTIPAKTGNAMIESDDEIESEEEDN
jgi:hypothetical protein